MDVSNKGEWLFTGITDGSLIQWSLHKRTVLKRFDRVHDLTLNCIVCTKLYYLTAGGDEILKQFDFTDGKEIKDYGRGNEAGSRILQYNSDISRKFSYIVTISECTI